MLTTDYPELTEGGVSGPITVLVAELVGEVCNTVRGLVPTHRKSITILITIQQFINKRPFRLQSHK